MAIEIPNQEAKVGIPGQWSEVIAAPLGALFLSSHPSALPFDYILGDGLNLKANTVVGFDADKKIVPAVKGSVDAIGVLVIDAVSDSSGGIGVPVYRTGHFNHKRLIWDTSYATEQDKLMAFEGAPTPTQIRIGTPKTYTP
ncbi:head decoration protein [Ochrobactrum sp. GPK 3]